MSLLDTASLVITPNGTKASKLYSVVPTSGAGDMTVTRATTASRVNSAGLIESVASNVPRLDYSNGTCPSILVEPQRTNLALYSEQLNDSSWLKFNATVTANTSVSPDGNTTADTITSNASSGGDVYRSMAVSGIHTFSAYFKAGTTNICRLGSTVGGFADFNLSNQTYTLSGGISASITSVGNGWSRCTLTVNITATTLVYLSSFDITGKTVFVWGAQLELGSYATSYIPTTSASVTRNADVISKTGISSLIGQTEGTMFVDFYYNGNSKDFIPIELYGSGRLTFYVGANNILYYEVSGTSVAIETLSALTNGRYKIACIYKANDFALYLNGVQQGTFNSGSIPTLNALNISDLSVALGAYKQQIEVNNVALWKTRLTNTQLAQLTTI